MYELSSFFSLLLLFSSLPLRPLEGTRPRSRPRRSRCGKRRMIKRSFSRTRISRLSVHRSSNTATRPLSCNTPPLASGSRTKYAPLSFKTLIFFLLSPPWRKIKLLRDSVIVVRDEEEGSGQGGGEASRPSRGRENGRRFGLLPFTRGGV